MGHSFEAESLESVDIDRAHEKAKQVIVDCSLQEEDFEDVYRGRVDEDLKKVKELEEKFEREETARTRELKKIADIFEGLVLWNGEQNDWFGPHAKTLKTSKYDDYVNGVDMVIEFFDEEERTLSHLGLAADITFTSDTTAKFDRLRKNIERGELVAVDYFHSEPMSLHGRLSDLPEVVIGADRKTVLELTELWMERENAVLARHKIQIMILMQMKEQLETFAGYARSLAAQCGDKVLKLKQENVAEKCEDRLVIVNELLDSKKDIAKEVQFELGGDSVHSEIMGFMKSWKASIMKKSK